MIVNHPGYTKMGCAAPVFGFIIIAVIFALGLIAFSAGWLR